MKKVILWAVLANLAFLAIAGSSLGQVPPPADPVPPPADPVPGEHDDVVNIFRDIYGVPHVYAFDENEVFFGIGYALAQDNLDGILFRYLAASGKLAQALGAEYVENDLFVRRFKIVAEAEAVYADALFPQELRTVYTHFINGIKQYMADNPAAVPIWWNQQIAPLTLTPSLLTITGHWGGIVQNSITAYADCKNGEVDLGVPKIDKLAIYNAPAYQNDVSYGSNVMVLMDSKTAGTNEVFFSTDNHSNASSQRNEIRIHGGTLQVMGIVAAGAALPNIGHTNNVAWGVTSGGPDIADCYSFDIDQNSYDPIKEDWTRYMYDGVADSFIVEEDVTIDVKGSAPLTVDLQYVLKNGLEIPVLLKQDGKAYAAAVAYQGNAGRSDFTITLMNQATDMASFRAALDYGGFGQFNIMAADTDGNAFYIRHGLVPRRSEAFGFDWNKIVDGSDPNSDWQDVGGSIYHPISDLVQVLNPSEGYMQNNNVPPHKMLDDLDVPAALERGVYPDYIFNAGNKSHQRGERANELLRPLTSATLADFSAIVMDEKWINAVNWSQALAVAVSFVDNPPANSWSDKPVPVKDAAERIINFGLDLPETPDDPPGEDGIAKHESVAALNYAVWLDQISRSSTAPKAIVCAVTGEKCEIPNTFRPLTSTENTELITSLEVAVDTMTIAWGSTDVTLGDVFGVGRGEAGVGSGVVRVPLGGLTAKVGGHWREQTLRAFDFAQIPGTAQFDMTTGQRNPLVMTLSPAGIVSESAVPYGQSGDSDSDHYSDQSILFRDKELKPTFFNYSDLKINLDPNDLDNFITVPITPIVP